MDWKSKLQGCRRSLTIWFNGLIGTAIILLPEAQSQFPQLEGYLSESLYRSLMGAIIVANIILRFKTTADLAQKAKQP